MKKGAKSCQAAYTSKEKLEQGIIGKLKEYVLNYDNLKQLVQLVNNEMDSVAEDYNDRLIVVFKEIENVDRRLERLYDALETGSLTLADLAPRIQHLRQKQEQLNLTRLELEALLSDRKVELADEKTVKDCVEQVKDMLENSTLTERKSFIKNFVREVRVKGDEVSLSYIPPLLSGMMAKETMTVPHIIHNGGR